MTNRLIRGIDLLELARINYYVLFLLSFRWRDQLGPAFNSAVFIVIASALKYPDLLV